MKRAALAVILVSIVGLAGCSTAADHESQQKPLAADAKPDWRQLPLSKGDAIDPSWSLVGFGRYVVDGDAIRTDPAEGGLGLLVYTKEKFGDCQLRIVYKTKDARSNAGVYVRIDDGILQRLDSKHPPAKRDADGKLPQSELAKFKDAADKELGAWWPVHHGYEVQICDTGGEFHRTGAVYSLAKAASLPQAEPGAWRTMVITLKGSQIQVEVDGKAVSSFDSEAKDLPPQKNWTEPRREPKRPTAGYIGLQVHDPGDLVWFKEISVRPLQEAKGQ